MRPALVGRRLDPRPVRPGARVTVVIPCYNYARFLGAAVNSVLSQRGVEVDVVIVDDSSLDDSVAVAGRLADQDERVRLIRNEHNMGAVATFNRGLAAVSGEFVVRLDADDLLTPGSLERSVAALQAMPSVGLVYGHPLHFSGDALPPPRDRPPRSWTLWRGSDWLAARCEDGTNTITSPEVVMRRAVVDVVGGQRDLAHTHDMEMWLRIAAHSDVAYLPGVDQAWHRDHAGSLSTAAEEPLVILGEVRDAYDVLFDADPSPAHERLRSRARTAVAGEALDQAMRLLDRGVADTEVAARMAFAESCAPSITTTRVWAKAKRALERGPRSGRSSAILGLLPRLVRRARYVRRYRRWTRTGVFERSRTVRVSRENRGIQQWV